MINDEQELYSTKIYRNNCNGSCSCCGCGSNVGPAGPMGLQGPPGPQGTRIIGNCCLSKNAEITPLCFRIDNPASASVHRET